MLAAICITAMAIRLLPRLSWNETRRSAERSHCVLDSARWRFLAVVTLALGVLTVNPALATQTDRSGFERINIVGEDHRNGLFDVSIEYDNAGSGWLAYSRVEVPKHVQTHLAKSTDGGKTWKYAGAANRSAEGSVVINGMTRKGVWRYETPTLLFDPQDIAARRWKLFVQRYLAMPPYQKGNSLFENGWIEYKYAAIPAGPWSDAICPFGKPETNCQVDLNSLHPDLKGNVFYNELGSIAVDGTIYLSMDASPTPTGFGKWEHRKIVLVSSQDHGITWTYVGTLTNFDDASALGYRVLTGSSLVKENGRLFLLITPSGAKGLFAKNRGHDGTLVVAFEDIRRARLERDVGGKPVVLNSFKVDLHSGGLSDYDEQNTWGGVLISQIDTLAKREFFQIFSARRRIGQRDAAADADKPRR